MAAYENAVFLDVEARVRYWEDASVNGVDDEDGSRIPGKVGAEWRAMINLADGRIEHWPAGTVAKIHYKVCDEGEYWLADADGNRLAKYRSDYVPNEFLCHGGNGFGDYIILTVGEDGQIADYQRPEIDPEFWIPIN